MKKLMISNLDSTLLSTIVDPVHSANHALWILGYPTHEVASYNFVMGNGTNKLFERASPEGEKTKENVFRVRKKSLLHYDRHNADESRSYPGIPELLGALRNKGHKLAVVFNKCQAATKKLIAHYFPRIRFVTVFDQREGVKVKPDPIMVYDILQIAGVPKEEVLYINNSGVNTQTAINSEVTPYGVTRGFHPHTELELFYPDFMVDKAEAVLSIVQ